MDNHKEAGSRGRETNSRPRPRDERISLVLGRLGASEARGKAPEGLKEAPGEFQEGSRRPSGGLQEGFRKLQERVESCRDDPSRAQK